jgi:hypothetical protein
MGPNGARNQEWLFWRRPAANYIQRRKNCTLEKLILPREMLYRHAKFGGNVYSVVEMQKNRQTHTLLYKR